MQRTSVHHEHVTGKRDASIALNDVGVRSFGENGFAVLTEAFVADELAAEVDYVFADAFGIATRHDGQPARFVPGADNGRALHDDAFGTALSLFNGAPLGVSPSPHPVVATFPQFAPAGHRDLPALAELFGLREHAPDDGVR
jgi:hypothetical protein